MRFVPLEDPFYSSGWLADGEHGTVARISKRIEDMTDLTTKTAEALQVPVRLSR